MKRCLPACIGLLLGAFQLQPPAAAGATWRILPAGDGDAPTIQAGIDSAAAGDTVLLAAGTFSGTGNREIDFLGKAVVVTSEGGAFVTIVDCEDGGRGFYFRNGEDAGSVLSGVTVLDANSGGKSAGAILCSGASPAITGNRIVSSLARGGGGGVFCIDGASPVIDGNTFAGNSADQGGAIWCANFSSPAITNNVFHANIAAVNGGAILCAGFSIPLIRNNTLSENTAGQRGGGIYCTNSSPVIANNIIAFSTSGEAVACDPGSSPLLICNDIFGNAGGDAVCGRDGGDNISLDPLFCGVPGSGNFFLQAISPCAPEHSPCGAAVGALPVDCGVTASERRTWSSIKHRYRNN